MQGWPCAKVLLYKFPHKHRVTPSTSGRGRLITRISGLCAEPGPGQIEQVVIGKQICPFSGR